MTATMDFFGHQDRARKRTALLVFYFSAAVVMIILAIYAGVAFGLQKAEVDIHWAYSIWNAELFLGVSAVVVLIVLAGTLYKVSELSGAGGGMRVASQLGGTLISTQTADRDERRVLNVVEEMALASGTPVPPVYMLDEDSINAFAAGYSSSDAVVAVTRGAVHSLNRDELQGVIAHEFSHILNGDMRLNIRLIAVLNGIVLLAIIGATILRLVGRGSAGRRRSSSSKKGGGGGAVILAILLVAITFTVVGYIGQFFARLIQMAVSREREYLADASAVQFTRNPGGIAGALRKIGGFAYGSRIENAHAKAVSHMFFAEGIKKSFASMFSTHPDLTTRIKRIDPRWDGNYPSGTDTRSSTAGASKISSAKLASLVATEGDSSIEPPGFDGVEPEGQPERWVQDIRKGKKPSGTAVFEVSMKPQDVVASVGTMSPEAMAFASGILRAMPKELVRAAHEPFGARAVVFGLLLDSQESIRNTQLEHLTAAADGPVMHELSHLSAPLAALTPNQRLPLLELALSGLRELSAAQWNDFVTNVDALIHADDQVSLFEFVLRTLILRQKRNALREAPVGSTARPLAAVIPEIVTLLSVLAWYGNGRKEDAAKEAFAQGVRRLGPHHARLEPLAFDSLKPERLERPLEILAGAGPNAKRAIIEACVACVTADTVVGIEEAELLRAVGSALDCPVPPFDSNVRAA